MSSNSAKSNLKGALLALLAFAIYATHDVIVKSLGASYGPFQIVFFSVLLSFPIAMIMLIRDNSDGDLRPRHLWMSIIRTIAAVIAGVSAFYAFSSLPLAQAYALLFSTPLLITVLAIPVLGEKVGIHRWSAIIVGLVGVVIVLQPGQTELGLGHLAGLMAAVSGAVASIIVRKIGDKERTVVLMLYPMLANFVIMAAILPFTYLPMPVEHLGAFGLIAVLGFVATLLVIAAYRSGEAVIVAPMQYSQIIWASFFGIIFFDEQLEAATVVGTLVIVASGLYIVLREGKPNVSNNTPVLETRNRTETGTSPRLVSLLRLGRINK